MSEVTLCSSSVEVLMHNGEDEHVRIVPDSLIQFNLEHLRNLLFRIGFTGFWLPVLPFLQELNIIAPRPLSILNPSMAFREARRSGCLSCMSMHIQNVSPNFRKPDISRESAR